MSQPGTTALKPPQPTTVPSWGGSQLGIRPGNFFRFLAAVASTPRFSTLKPPQLSKFSVPGGRFLVGMLLKQPLQLGTEFSEKYLVPGWQFLVGVVIVYWFLVRSFICCIFYSDYLGFNCIVFYFLPFLPF
jgi:hypothetical protein